jgi:hypothetical protein
MRTSRILFLLAQAYRRCRCIGHDFFRRDLPVSLFRTMIARCATGGLFERHSDLKQTCFVLDETSAE